MKCVLALSFLLAAVSADAIHGVVPAHAGHVVATPTSSQYHAQDVLGQYEYGYSSPLSSKHEARTFDGITRGGYSYVDGHGLVQSAQYVSDPYNGFRVAATNLPVGPGVPAPAVHAYAAPVAAPVVAPVAAPAVHAYAAPAIHAYAAPTVAHVAPGSLTSQVSSVTHDGIVSHANVGHGAAHSAVVTAAGISSVASPVAAPLAHALAHPVAHSYVTPYASSLLHLRRKRSPGFLAYAAPGIHAYAAPGIHAYAAPTVAHVAPGSLTSQVSSVTHDGIVSHANVGFGPSHSSVVTAAGISSVASPVAAPLVHPVAHSYVTPYASSLLHLRRKRSPGFLALGHVPASTAPLAHAYAAPAVVAAPAVHAYAAPAVHAYSHSAVVAAPAVHAYAAPAVHAYAAPAAVGVASSRHHIQDELGQYDYGYNDGFSAKQEVRTHDGVTRGAYSYVDPRGIVQSVHYAADGLGFRAAATNII